MMYKIRVRIGSAGNAKSALLAFRCSLKTGTSTARTDNSATGPISPYHAAEMPKRPRAIPKMFNSNSETMGAQASAAAARNPIARNCKKPGRKSMLAQKATPMKNKPHMETPLQSDAT